MSKTYPSHFDRFWMKPGSDIPALIGPYSLLAVKSYGLSKRDATYQCICLRCGCSHVIKRTELQAMVRTQKRRKQPFNQLSGNCPKCQISDPPSVTWKQYLLKKLAANGLRVAHVFVNCDSGVMARVRVCNPDGTAVTCEVKHATGEKRIQKVEMDSTGFARWLVSADHMFERLMTNLLESGVTTIAYQDADGRDSLYLRP